MQMKFQFKRIFFLYLYIQILLLFLWNDFLILFKTTKNMLLLYYLWAFVHRFQIAFFDDSYLSFCFFFFFADESLVFDFDSVNLVFFSWWILAFVVIYKNKI